MRNPAMNMAESSKFCMVLGFVCVLLLFSVMDIYNALEPVDILHAEEEAVIALISTGIKTPAAASARKLLDFGDDDNGNGTMNRIGMGSPSCSKDSILVFQGPSTPLPNGIPTYGVQVQNVCVEGTGGTASCSIADIHLTCGWFSSARLINPGIFRRINYDDCLVNDGKPLNSGQCLTFEYANTFPYPMSVSSATCT